jgi:integrase
MSVYKRGGHWHFRKTINGVRYRGALKTARNKVQAEQGEAAVILEIHHGSYGSRNRRSPTLQEFVDSTFRPWAEANRRSWKGDEGRLKSILRYFGNKRLDEISPFMIEKFKIERRKAKVQHHNAKTPSEKLLSIASINREISLLSRVFSIAVMSKEAQTNPCRDVKHIPGEQPRTRYLLPDEEARLWSVLDSKAGYLGAIVRIALNTGMRRGEVLRLKWNQIDFFREEIKAIKTKNGHDRLIPMNGPVKAVVLRLRKGSTGEYLFPSPKKTGCRITDIKKGFNAAVKEAGIPDFHFHDLRHTFGTRAADMGVSMNAIADVMGHADIHTTRRYAHSTDEGRRMAVAAVEMAGKPATKKTQKVVGGKW